MKGDHVLFCHCHVSSLWEEVVWGPEGQDLPSVRVVVFSWTDQREILYFCVCNRGWKFNSHFRSSAQRVEGKKQFSYLLIYNQTGLSPNPCIMISEKNN